MHALSRRDADGVKAISVELDTLRLGSRGVMDEVLPQVRALLELDTVLLYSLKRNANGWELDRWDHDRVPTKAKLIAQKLFPATPEILFYDLLRPAISQRNRAVEATAWIDRDVPGTWAASRLCREVMAPVHLDRHRQLRALVCDGPALLAWFGGMHSDPVSARQHQLLGELIPAMRRRLSIELRIETAPRRLAALEAALNRLGSPSFVLGARGEIHEMNEAGRVLLEERLVDVARALRAAVARRPSSLEFELIEFREPGLAVHWLAILRADSIDARITACVRSSAARWKLTTRQTSVLDLVTRGMGNASIGATLDISDRAVELHVTVLLGRAGVVNRAALVGCVLLAAP